MLLSERLQRESLQNTLTSAIMTRWHHKVYYRDQIVAILLDHVKDHADDHDLSRLADQMRDHTYHHTYSFS